MEAVLPNLDDEQTRAVTNSEGPLLVVREPVVLVGWREGLRGSAERSSLCVESDMENERPQGDRRSGEDRRGGVDRRKSKGSDLSGPGQTERRSGVDRRRGARRRTNDVPAPKPRM